MKLTFVVNGEDADLDLDATRPFLVWRDAALTTTKNTGRPFAEWEIYASNGPRVDPESTPEARHTLEGTRRFFLALRVGAGGMEELLRVAPVGSRWCPNSGAYRVTGHERLALDGFYKLFAPAVRLRKTGEVDEVVVPFVVLLQDFSKVAT